MTLTDVMETIAGNLPVAGEELDARHDIQQTEDGCWIANGYMPLEDLVLYLPLPIDENVNTTHWPGYSWSIPRGYPK